MRRLSLTLLVCGLIGSPAALAASTATGDGILELRNVDAYATISGKGAIWGQVDTGRLVVTDPQPGDGQVFVSGAEHSHVWDDGITTSYWGKNIHFRITGGTYQLKFKALAGDVAVDPAAQGIDLTAVGVGTMKIAGDVFSTDAGSYALDGGKWIPVPTSTPKTVAFPEPSP
ncbi:MAG TPA: hypothetical protein VFA05_11720 [Gaiellaceae bacterium]|nr:hypothetical protein [Gaiellaceae bacterium]